MKIIAYDLLSELISDLSPNALDQLIEKDNFKELLKLIVYERILTICYLKDLGFDRNEIASIYNVHPVTIWRWIDKSKKIIERSQYASNRRHQFLKNSS